MALTHTPHQIIFSTVTHKRRIPTPNAFSYGIYYTAISLSQLNTLPLAHNRPGLLSFYDKDHGPCDGTGLENWARTVLNDHGITHATGDITLICMPRVLGYVFNPVSFWLCHDKDGAIRAILCEVHNTFKERHTYICAKPDESPITPHDTLTGDKLFHVSPFLERAGHYSFRFLITPKKLHITIDYYNTAQDKHLITALTGTAHPMNKATRRKAFWTYPLVTFKAIILIHWQALKLTWKKVRYIKKPKQNTHTTSRTD